MDLKQYINRQKKTLGEVALFKEMIGYFNSKPYASVVSRALKTHQHKVMYTPFPPYYGAQNWGKSVTKEISDVFIIVFSEERDLARMTHLQVKLEKNHGLDKNTGNFIFKLDAGQYLMLHNRLQIHDKTGLFPDIILASPLYSDSIASYGVFYKDGNDYNMAYEIASLITPPAPIRYTRKGQQTNHNFATIQDLWGYFNIKYSGVPFYHLYPRPYHYELVSTVDIKTFESELYNVRVGTRVDFDIQMMKKIESLFAKRGCDLKGFDKFIQNQEVYWGNGPIIGVQNDGKDGDGRDNRPSDFNIDKIDGTYLLINADMTDKEE